MASALSISAIVVTRNRERYLRESVRSLMEQSLPTSDYEVIVVNNGSTDGTADVVASMKRCHDNLRYVFAGTEGSSRARNAGLAEARAPIVAYIDDDAVASHTWLEEMLRTFERFDPRPACVGGRILPLWETAPPAWFPRRYLPSLSMLDLGDEARQLKELEFIVGANMAFVRDELVAAGGFNDEISLYADEIYVQDRIRERGGVIVYAPAPWVHHHVPAGRLTLEYMRRRKYRGGKGEISILTERLGTGGATRLLLTNVVMRPLHLARLALALAFNTATGREAAAIENKIQLSRSRGMMVQASVLLSRRIRSRLRR
ncbi:MAG: glycosyltransferase [Rubricoccaceae bacterium]|nr:glycosyltransferase [Rubricoccaceae bacterium]